MVTYAKIEKFIRKYEKWRDIKDNFMLIVVVLIVLVGTIYTFLPKETFSTVFPLQTDVRLSGYVRESCKGVTRQKLIDYFGSERVLRNILLSYKIPKDIPITDKTAPAIANLISGGDTNNLC